MPEANPVPTPTPKRTRKSRTASGHSQTIPLESGGSITLSGDFNLFTMSTEDVAFVSDLGGKMREYINRPRTATAAPNKGVTPPAPAARPTAVPTGASKPS